MREFPLRLPDPSLEHPALMDYAPLSLEELRTHIERREDSSPELLGIWAERETDPTRLARVYSRLHLGTDRHRLLYSVSPAGLGTPLIEVVFHSLEDNRFSTAWEGLLHNPRLGPESFRALSEQVTSYVLQERVKERSREGFRLARVVCGIASRYPEALRPELEKLVGLVTEPPAANQRADRRTGFQGGFGMGLFDVPELSAEQVEHLWRTQEYRMEHTGGGDGSIPSAAVRHPSATAEFVSLLLSRYPVVEVQMAATERRDLWENERAIEILLGSWEPAVVEALVERAPDREFPPAFRRLAPLDTFKALALLEQQPTRLALLQQSDLAPLLEHPESSHRLHAIARIPQLLPHLGQEAPGQGRAPAVTAPSRRWC